jgi:hypothetical protein
MPRESRVFVHLVVANLTVSRPWRVGPATLYPPGHLLNRLDSHLAGLEPRPPDLLVQEYRRDLVDRAWSTIRVPTSASGGRISEQAMNAARDVARDVIAVLRLFQRVRAPMVNLDRQTFGLATDIGRMVEPRWITDRNGRFGVGWQVHGVMAPWAFRAEDRLAFCRDARFDFLDSALTASNQEWQRRSIAAVRNMNLATIMQRPATRSSFSRLHSKRFSGTGSRQAALRQGAIDWPDEPRTFGARPIYSLRLLTDLAVEVRAPSSPQRTLVTTVPCTTRSGGFGPAVTTERCVSYTTIGTPLCTAPTVSSTRRRLRVTSGI